MLDAPARVFIHTLIPLKFATPVGAPLLDYSSTIYGNKYMPAGLVFAMGGDTAEQVAGVQFLCERALQQASVQKGAGFVPVRISTDRQGHYTKICRPVHHRTCVHGGLGLPMVTRNCEFSISRRERKPFLKGTRRNTPHHKESVSFSLCGEKALWS